MGEAPANFLEILKKLWWPLDQSLHEEDVYYSAMVCLIDAIKHGQPPFLIITLHRISSMDR